MSTMNPRKRRRQDSDETSESPSRRVPFNTDETQDSHRKSLLLASVKEAFRKRAEGDNEGFHGLIARFKSETALANSESSLDLRYLLVALSHMVSSLDRLHSPLVEAILSIPWATAEPIFVRSYISFIGALVSARPEYSNAVLERLISGLTYQSGLRPLEQGPPDNAPKPLMRSDIYDRQHELLEHILWLIPTLSNTLLPILLRNFPHKRLNMASQITYIRNLLRITQYSPELYEGILATIIDRAIQIDVEIQVELEELEGDDGDAELIFDLDPFDKEIGAESDDSSDDGDCSDDGLAGLSDISSEGSLSDEAGEFGSNSAHMRAQADKLDAMLRIIFEHFCSPNGADGTAVSKGSPLPDTSPSIPTTEEGRSLRRIRFRTLLSIFERTILRTFKSRYTQFLVFWYSSLDPEFTNDFLGSLSTKALIDEEQAIIIRAAAASYVASFVSRAQFVDAAQTQQVVKLMCEHLSQELTAFSALDGPPYSTSFTLFYVIVQAVFLIFCFRWRDLYETALDGEADDDVPKRWIRDLDILHQAVISGLNPLKVCSLNVVKQFARVAKTTGFMYCHSIIESNKHNELLGTSQSTLSLRTVVASDSTSSNLSARTLHSTSGAGPKMNSSLNPDGAVMNDLDTFFPFDPYNLRTSHQYIDSIYRQWSSVAIGDDDDESDEEDDDDETDKQEQDEDDVSPGDVNQGKDFSFHIPFSRNPKAAKSAEDLNESFGGMSISPVRHIGSAIAA